MPPPPVEEEEEAEAPLPPPCELAPEPEEEAEPLPAPLPPVEVEEEEAEAPLPPYGLDDEPLPPHFEIDEDAEDDAARPAPPAPVLPSAPPAPEEEKTATAVRLPAAKKEGTGLMIGLGLGVAVAVGLALQFQSNIGRYEQKNQQLRQELAEYLQATKLQQNLIAETKLASQQVEEAEARVEQLKAERASIREEYTQLAPLRYNSVPLSELMDRAQAACRTLEEQLADLDARMLLYLPPEKLSAEQLQERDTYLKKYAGLYLRARSIGCTAILYRMCAPTLEHYAFNMQPTSASNVANLLDNVFRKERIHSSYRLKALGYHGLRVELVSEVTTADQSLRWSKEIWLLNENGEIMRWNEILSTGVQPSISQGYHIVK